MLCLKKSSAILDEIGEEYQWARTQVALAQLHIIEKEFSSASENLNVAAVIFDKLEARLDIDELAELRQAIR